MHGLRQNRDAAILFPVAAAEWLALKKPGWAAKTYVNAKTDVTHLKQSLGKLLLTDITDREIASYQAHRHGEQASNKTINNEVGTLRAILRRYRLWAQVAPDVRTLRVPEDAGRALAREEEERLLRACASSRSRSLWPAVTLALQTGLRHDELRLLRWRQIDFDNSAVTVGQSKTTHGTGRSVSLNGRAVKVFTEWAREFPNRRPSHYVFPSEKVGVATDGRIPAVFDTNPEQPIGSWRVAWTTARRRAGVTCRFHDLRHTTVTRLLELGVPFAVVATIMGWSPATSVRMAKRYGHIGPSAQREAMALLERAEPGAKKQEKAATVQ